ncbi:hypothetical protein MY1884_002387 [Beauveria asiatica]
MSGKLQSGQVSPTPSYEGEHDMRPTDTEYQPDEDCVDLVTTDASGQMELRTRSQSSKSKKGCGLTLSRSDSTSAVAAASSANNAKRCIQDNQQPIKKRINHCINNDSAYGLQYFHDRIRQERETIDNRLTEERENMYNLLTKEREYIDSRLTKEREYIDNRLAEDREQLYQEIDHLKMNMSEGAKKEKAAAEKITDDTIKTKWDTLRYNIRSVVLMLRSYEPEDAKNTLEILQLRIPGASFIDSPKGYLRDIFEGYLELYIWKFVSQDVFRGSGRQWRGSIFNNFQAMRREAISAEKDPEKIAELALWLSQGSEAVTSQLDKELQQPMADDFAESIFAMFQPHPKPTHKDQIKEVLGVVVYDATELAIMFVSSKALLLPALPCGELLNEDLLGTYFDINHLPGNVSKGKYVDTRPALIKFGTADGEKHDVSVILCKSARLYF